MISLPQKPDASSGGGPSRPESIAMLPPAPASPASSLGSRNRGGRSTELQDAASAQSPHVQSQYRSARPRIASTIAGEPAFRCFRAAGAQESALSELCLELGDALESSCVFGLTGSALGLA